MKNTVFAILKTVSINSARTAAFIKKNYKKTRKTAVLLFFEGQRFLSSAKFSFSSVIYPSKSFIKESISSSL